MQLEVLRPQLLLKPPVQQWHAQQQYQKSIVGINEKLFWGNPISASWSSGIRRKVIPPGLVLSFPARRNARSDPPLPKGTHGVPDSKVIASTSPILASKAFLSLKSLALKIYPKVRLEIRAEGGFPPS